MGRARSFSFVILGILSIAVCGADASKAAQGDAGAGPPEFVPSSIDEALRALRYSAAKDIDWRPFGLLTSATYHGHGHDGGSRFDGTYTKQFSDVDASGATFFFPGESGRTKAEFDVPDFDAANATPDGSDEVTIGAKSYRSE